MPWNARDTMSLRLEFVHLALHPDANRRELCRRFGISPKTAYKWLARHDEKGDAALSDRSRRPRHSRARTDRRSVQPWLTQAFRRYGLPVRINADNGAPWGSPREHRHGISPFTVWLIRLGVRVSHSRPAHPQTNGKDERFHRSLKAEV